MAFGSSDYLSATRARTGSWIPSADLTFHRVDARWRGGLGGGRLEASLTAGWDRVRLLAREEGRVLDEIGAVESSLASRVGWTYECTQLSLAFGVDGERRAGKTSLAGVQSLYDDGPAGRGLHQPDGLAGLFGGGFAELRWTPFDTTTLIGGVRGDVYHLLEDKTRQATQTTIEPRLTAFQKLGDRLLLKAGVGLAHQPPTALVPLPVLELAGLSLGLQRALHTTLGIEYQPTDQLSVSLDGYWSELLRTVEFEPFTLVDNRRRGGLSDGPAREGRSHGVEAMVRRSGRTWNGWLSYGWQRSLRLRTFERFDAHNTPIGTATAWLPFAFEQRHVVTAAFTLRLASRWTLGATLHLNTGRPENGEISSRTRRAGTDDAGHPAWVRLDLDEVDRLPLYFRADLRVARTFVLDALLLEVYLDIYNAGFSHEVLGFEYALNPYGPDVYRKHPFDLGTLVLPMLGVRGSY